MHWLNQLDHGLESNHNYWNVVKRVESGRGVEHLVNCVPDNLVDVTLFICDMPVYGRPYYVMHLLSRKFIENAIRAS